jgi:hypothetical protein
VLRTFVTGRGPPFGGGGKPQRIMVRLRAPLSTSLMIGAKVSGDRRQVELHAIIDMRDAK